MVKETSVSQSYQTRRGDKFLHMSCRIKYFANSIFPYTIKERNNLSPEIRKSVSYEVFENSLLKFIRPTLMFLIVLESNFLLDYF